ncbi:MAG: TIGR03435 family protein [Acidobacteriaceae bacterium]
MRTSLIILTAAITLLTLATPTIPAQELAVAPPGSPRLTFDIIVIHPSNPDDKGGFIKPMPSGRGYLVQNIPVRLLISLMYKIPQRQITGGPHWLDTEPFDIEAKADKAYTVDDLHTMFQDLLADRFNLKFHVDKKEGNIYALTIDGSGLKMKPNTSPPNYAISVQPTGFASITGTRVSMRYLCWQLGQFLQDDHRPVINFTGLTGNYDFKLEFLPPNLPPGIDKASLPPGFLDRPSLFTALREQLGLKLKAQKGPVTYFVIDHIDKPTEN